jgi:hypothetical protein
VGGCLAGAGLVLLVSAGPALALDEAQITDVTCTGLHVTQRGLPPRLEVEVDVVDSHSGRKLADVDTAADASGYLDVHVAAALRDVQQIVVEVESRATGTEYGEAGADLPQPCSDRPAPIVTEGVGRAAATPAPRPAGFIGPRVAGPTPSARTAPAPTGTPAATPAPAAASGDPAQDGTDGRIVALVVVGVALLGAAGVAVAVRRGRS